MATLQDDETMELDAEQTLEELLEPAASRSQVAALTRKVDQLMQLLAAKGIEIDTTPTVDNNNTRGKKRSLDEASDGETPPAVRQRLNTEAEAIRYTAKAKEPNIPLPDAFDGNPKNLKKFFAE